MDAAPVLDKRPPEFDVQPEENRGDAAAALREFRTALDAWPTPDHLHQDLKRLCGYVDWYANPLTGRDEMRVQSTAFAKMSEAEFALYFRMAQMRFTEKMGFDPWAREAVQ